MPLHRVASANQQELRSLCSEMADALAFDDCYNSTFHQCTDIFLEYVSAAADDCYGGSCSIYLVIAVLPERKWDSDDTTSYIVKPKSRIDFLASYNVLPGKSSASKGSAPGQYYPDDTGLDRTWKTAAQDADGTTPMRSHSLLSTSVSNQRADERLAPDAQLQLARQLRQSYVRHPSPPLLSTDDNCIDGIV